MNILFDNGTPKPIARALVDHKVVFARAICWHGLTNGDLIRSAEDAGFDVLLSTDKNIRYQQNLASRRLALVILGNSRWPTVQHHLPQIVFAVEASRPGSYIEVDIPLK